MSSDIDIVKGCVFDKDNTLMEPHALGIHEPLEGSMQNALGGT